MVHVTRNLFFFVFMAIKISLPDSTPAATPAAAPAGTEASLYRRPASVDQLAQAVREIAGRGSQVQVCGSNTMPLSVMDMTRPLETISTLRAKKLLDHSVADMTVVVEAGITLESLQQQLAWQNQWLPVDAPAAGGRAPMHRTIGGLIATNSLGALRLKFGDWRHHILGMKWVNSEGLLIKGGGRTVKNVAGYSTPRMLIGSAGSLGVIAEVTLRTAVRPSDEQIVLVFCDDAPAAATVITETLNAAVEPAYIELIGGQEFAHNTLGLPASNLVVAVGFIDRAELCRGQAELLRSLPGISSQETIALAAAQAGRLRLWMASEPTAVAAFRMVVPSSQVAVVMDSIRKAAEKSEGACWLVAEAAHGVIRGAWREEANTADFVRRARRIASKVGGQLRFLQAEHQGETGPPANRAGPSINTRIKNALDPKGVFGECSA